MASHGNIILDYHDTLLRESDVALLDEKQWINDNLIAFWLEYLEKELYSQHQDEIAFVAPQVVQFLKFGSPEDIQTMLLELHLPKKQLVLLPLNNCMSSESPGGTHWSLVTYTKLNGFQHYDSNNGSENYLHAKKIAEVLMPILQTAASFVTEVDSIQQENCYDCGLHVMCNADAICHITFGDTTKRIGDIATLIRIRKARCHLRTLISSLKN